METETDYLGCNDKSDEVMVDHLLHVMSGNENWVNQYNSNEYTPHRRVQSLLNSNHSRLLAMKNQMYTFCKTIFAAKKMRRYCLEVHVQEATV